VVFLVRGFGYSRVYITEYKMAKWISILRLKWLEEVVLRCSRTNRTNS
jgi:hypothetical protein